MVNVFRKQELQYGDLIRVSGKMHKPFNTDPIGHYSYEDYLKRNGINWIFSVKKSTPIKVLKHGQGHGFKAAFLKCHRRLQGVLEEHLSAFEAGFIQSLVLGGKYYIPDRTRDLFVQTGTAHILAISGMNVASMAYLVFIALNVMRLPRPGQLLLTTLFLIFYCLLTGTNPSVLRATIMAVVMLLGFLLEREENTINSLGLSAVIILVWDPLTLFDIGFQLSFTGVFSIVVIYPRIYNLIEPWAKGRTAKLLWQMLAVSLSAWLGVLPLIGYYFQVITPVSVLANIPILPFVTALFMLGTGLIAAGLVIPAWAVLFASCIKVVLFFLMVIVEFFSRIPYGCFFISEVKPYAVVIYYVFMAGLVMGLKAHAGMKEQQKGLHYLS